MGRRTDRVVVQGIESTAEGLLWLLTLWLQFKFTKFIVLVALIRVCVGHRCHSQSDSFGTARLSSKIGSGL